MLRNKLNKMVRSNRASITEKYKNSFPTKPPRGGKPAIDKIINTKCSLLSILYKQKQYKSLK